ncbi:cytochrome o ubiquinol oxidase subunit IV [Halomonas salifodinae]|uniref:cytochrome o ubiquinol oxidase subunit IV n=1 Tax=Halomonas salifodinae TaxID=438745 RepID=UPI0033BEF15C
MSRAPTTYGGASHGSVRSYTWGLLLSLVLTLIPFGLVMTGALAGPATVVVIAATAGLQILVQLVCFMHLDRDSEGGWTLLSLAFTVLILAIVVVGSLWIMHHLHHNVMPG